MNINELILLTKDISIEVAKLHSMIGCGQRCIQNFINENNLNGVEIIEYLIKNPKSKLDIKCFITNSKCISKREIKLRKKFLTKFKNKSYDTKGYSFSC
jgi:hypothetical protein